MSNATQSSASASMRFCRFSAWSLLRASTSSALSSGAKLDVSGRTAAAAAAAAVGLALTSSWSGVAAAAAEPAGSPSAPSRLVMDSMRARSTELSTRRARLAPKAARSAPALMAPISTQGCSSAAMSGPRPMPTEASTLQRATLSRSTVSATASKPPQCSFMALTATKKVCITAAWSSSLRYQIVSVRFRSRFIIAFGSSGSATPAAVVSPSPAPLRLPARLSRRASCCAR
mmetsp:Transcript_6795/g.19674  ORF Transcript_6795/g.19674 Transcript_6795/m.19674 type:complete len:231 (+) Transcript_6795:1795-2487(+)